MCCARPRAIPPRPKSPPNQEFSGERQRRGGNAPPFFVVRAIIFAKDDPHLGENRRVAMNDATIKPIPTFVLTPPTGDQLRTLRQVSTKTSVESSSTMAPRHLSAVSSSMRSARGSTLPPVRPCAVQGRNEVRKRHRLAKLRLASLKGPPPLYPGHKLRDGPDRDCLRALRRSPGSRVPRWPSADRRALLHQ